MKPKVGIIDRDNYTSSTFPDHDRDRIAAAGHQNKNRAFVHPVFIKSILQNPVYLIADKDAYQYFVDNEAELFAPESGKKASPPS